MTSANSANRVIAFPRARDRREKEEMAFLPAALEIVETPPSPTGRAIGATVIALFCVALAWAYLGKIDIVATATGKIVPDGRTKLLQPFETGVVRAIHVQDGQTVKAGDVLIELDPTMNAAETEHVRSDLVAAQLDIARLHAVLSDAKDPASEFNAPPGAAPELVAMERQFLFNQIAEHRAKIAGLEHQQGQKDAERGTIVATIEKLQASLPVMQERLNIRKTLYDHATGSKANYLELLQSFVEEEHDLDVQKSRKEEAEAALAGIIENRTQAEAEFRRTLLDDLAKAEQKVGGLSQDLIKAEQRTKLQQLTAPIDGVVQQLAVHTVGGVVTPAQALLVVVPVDSHLEVEAMVSNRDIGFVQAGQDAEIKIDTFNFTKYGLLHGKVLSVSQDAITRDKQQDRPNDPGKGAQSATPDSAGQDLVFAARVSLDRTQMQIDNKMVNLSPGMAVTVEVKTGSRRVIEYLLSPLLRFKQESLRER
jgi:hemolysin D